MKKEIIRKALYLTNGIIFLIMPLLVLAIEPIPATQLSIDRVYQLFIDVMRWIFAFAIVLAIIIIIWGGVTYMTAGGDDAKLGAAKKRIIWGLVGVAIVIAAWGLVFLISQYLGAQVRIPQ